MKANYFAILLFIDVCTSSPMHLDLETDKKLSAEDSSVDKIKEPPDLKKSFFKESTTTSRPLVLKEPETGSAPKPEKSTTPIPDDNGGSDETGDVDEDGTEINKNGSETTAKKGAGYVGKNVSKSAKEEVSATASSLDRVYSNLPNQFDVSDNLDDEIRHPVKESRLNSTDHVPWVTFKPSSNATQQDDAVEDFADSDASSTQTYVHESKSDGHDVTTEAKPVPEMVSTTPPSSNYKNKSKMEIDNEIVGGSKESKTIDAVTDVSHIPTISQKPIVISPVEQKEPADKPEVKMVEATSKPEVTTVKPSEKSVIKEVEPTDKPELNTVEPSDKSDIKMVDATDKPELKTMEPTDKPKFRTVEPTDKPELNTVEPSDKPELNTVEPTNKPELKTVEPTDKPEIKTVKPTDKPEIKTVEPINKPELKTVKQVFNDIKDITLHNAYAILLMSVAFLFILTWLVGFCAIVFFTYKLLRKCLTGLKNCVPKKTRVGNEDGILDAGSLFYPYQRPVLRPYVPDPGDRAVQFNDRRMFN